MDLNSIVGVVSLIVGVVSIAYAIYSVKQGEKVQSNVDKTLSLIKELSCSTEQRINSLQCQARAFNSELNGGLILSKDIIIVSVLDIYDHFNYGNVSDLLKGSVLATTYIKPVEKMLSFINDADNKGMSQLFYLKSALDSRNIDSFNNLQSSLLKYGIELRYECNP